jgi:hypothetical protein
MRKLFAGPEKLSGSGRLLLGILRRMNAADTQSLQAPAEYDMV